MAAPKTDKSSDPTVIYNLQEPPLGIGGFDNKTYEAIIKENKSKVVIKKIPKNTYKLIKTQIKLLKQCNSPFVIQLLNEHQDDDFNWVVLEFCSGGSIAPKIGHLKEKEIQKLTSHVLNGLLYLHENGIIHRDVKPQNILLHQNGIYKLADFGLAKDIDKSLAKTFAIGTPFYMAPEVLKKDDKNKSNYTPKIDVWSLGITLYYIVMNKYPYKANDAHQIMIKITTKTPKKKNSQKKKAHQKHTAIQPMKISHTPRQTTRIANKPKYIH
eukprot:547072_1